MCTPLIVNVRNCPLIITLYIQESRRRSDAEQQQQQQLGDLAAISLASEVTVMVS